MMLDRGDIVLICHRRLFEGDEARYFLGRTVMCEGSLIKVKGFSFVRDLANGHVVKKDEKRIKILSIESPGHMVYQLDNDLDLESCEIVTRSGESSLVCGVRKIMNLAEHTHCGQF